MSKDKITDEQLDMMVKKVLSDERMRKILVMKLKTMIQKIQHISFMLLLNRAD